MKPTHHNDGYGKLFLLKELATLNCMDYDIKYCITVFLPVHPLLKRCVVSPFISNPTSHKIEHRNAMENLKIKGEIFSVFRNIGAVLVITQTTDKMFDYIHECQLHCGGHRRSP